LFHQLVLVQQLSAGDQLHLLQQTAVRLSAAHAYALRQLHHNLKQAGR
jgi:hypothetical protein